MLSPCSRLCVWASVTSVSANVSLLFVFVPECVCVFISVFVCLCLCLFSAANGGFAFADFVLFILKRRKGEGLKTFFIAILFFSDGRGSG